jgi:hypothetical protein
MSLPHDVVMSLPYDVVKRLTLIYRYLNDIVPNLAKCFYTQVKCVENPRTIDEFVLKLKFGVILIFMYAIFDWF